MLPSGFPKWLRLMRAGQTIRARNSAFIEAMRSLHRSDSAKGSHNKATTQHTSRRSLMRNALVKTKKIIKHYTRWENRIESIEVRLPPALNPGENAALQEKGSLISRQDNTSFSSIATKASSPKAAPLPHNQSPTTRERTTLATPTTPSISTSPQASPAANSQSKASIIQAESGIGIITNIKG